MKLLLGEELDQVYVNKTREGAGGVTTRVVMVAAEGLCLAYNRKQIQINRLGHTHFLKGGEIFTATKSNCSNGGNIPELILNWDQTGLNILPSSPWTIGKGGEKGDLKDKCQM